MIYFCTITLFFLLRAASRLTLIASFLTYSSICAADEPAFPNAIGFGKNSIGWRGGDVVAITNLQNNGSGSLRNCVETLQRPRICVFDISGTILLDSPIFVSSNLYLAGQTAPGAGVQLRLRSGDATPLVIKNASNVLIRYLKIRPGAGTRKSANIDALTVESSQFVYLDALSMQFASDETFNIHVNKKPVHHVTLARSILTHSLDHSVHPKGRHSKGALICSNEGPLSAPVDCGLISIVQNLFAHHRDRNPDIKGTDIGPIEVINNVFYNPISQLGEFYDLLGDLTVHYVGNVTQSGPSSNWFPALTSVEAFDWDNKRSLAIFEKDNLNFGRNACAKRRSLPILDNVAQNARIDAPVTAQIFMALPADKMLDEIGKIAGAQLPQWGGLDVLDLRAVQDLKNCAGQVIDTPQQAGGWPKLIITTRDKDSDGDGMPDSWEKAKAGLDATVGGQAWQDRDQDGWSNIEEYLSWLAGDRVNP